MVDIPVPVVIVVAMDKMTRAIGFKNKLLWHVPADLKRFNTLTMGHPVIMGRKTFESILAILGKPLPGRTNIVVTRNDNYAAPLGVIVVASLDEAFAAALATNPTEIHIGGGAELYAQALPYASRLHLTFFDHPNVTADTFFPDFSPAFTIVKMYPSESYNGRSYQWIDFDRIT